MTPQARLLSAIHDEVERIGRHLFVEYDALYDGFTFSDGKECSATYRVDYWSENFTDQHFAALARDAVARAVRHIEAQRGGEG